MICSQHLWLEKGLKPLLAFELEPPSLLNYLFRGSCIEARSEDEFLKEARLVSRHSDLIRIAEALPEHPYLSSLTSLNILKRSRVGGVKFMCDIRATEISLNALIQQVGEAILQRCDYLVLEGSQEGGRDLGKVIEAYKSLRKLRLTDHINVGLEVYVNNRMLIDECVKAEPSFLILRMVDMGEVEEARYREVAAPNLLIFIRIPMFDLTGLGLMSTKAIESIAEEVVKMLSQNLNVIVAAPHGFEEAFEVLKRVRGVFP
jgi:hypothetical protein